MTRLKSFMLAFVMFFMMTVTDITASAVSMQICYDGGTHNYTGEVYGLFVNGNKIESEMEPIIFNDHALVPVREVFEECGAAVEYIQDSRCVKVHYNGTIITMHINNNCAYINGKPVQIPDNVVPKLIYKPGGLTKTMVPVRFISESVGMNVKFDGQAGEIKITEAGFKPENPIATTAPTKKPAATPTPTPAPESVSITSITGSMVSDTKIKIVADCSASPSGKVSYFDLKEPERVVVDFKGMTFDGDADIEKSGNIKSVRTGVDSERTRLVVDIENLTGYSVEVKSDRVVITVSVAKDTTSATVKPTSKPSATKKPTATEKPTATKKPVATKKPSATKRPSYPKGIVQASSADSKKIIMLDAGHGGSDPGALGTLDGKTIKEKDLTLSITKKVQSILNSYGYKTALTRKGDTLPSLAERPEMANDLDCALFVSIHINSATAVEASGTEVYYSDENNGDEYGVTSQELAENILEGMLKYMKSGDRGVRMANWAVTRRANMPAILLEVGFISNEDELRLMCSSSYQDKVAKGIAEGIINTIHYVDVP